MDGNTTEIVKLVLDFLEKTANVVVQTGFQISIKYVIAGAVVELVKFVVAGALTVVSAMNLKRAWNKGETDGWGENEPSSTFWRAVLWGVLFLILLATTLWASPFEAIKKLIAPEWYAILSVLELVK